MNVPRVSRAALALAPLVSLVALAVPAHADGPTVVVAPLGDPLVPVPNCPFDALAPHQMRCLSSSLLPLSMAQARMGQLTAPPDAGAGVDASSAIGTCNGKAPGHGGGTASGLGPPDFQALYDIPASPTGAGKVVAIVDACSDPSVVTDLAAYRTKYGLPALPQCGGGIGHAPVPGGAPCFGVVSQRGDATIGASDSGWAGEIALDVDMVSAACPDCSILLVEADSPNSWDLGPAVSEAITLGAAAVSNSYGAPEDPKDAFGTAYSDGPYTTYYQHAGVLIAVASGDGLYNNQKTQNNTVLAPSFPSTIPAVLSVGGTIAKKGTGTARGGYSEVVWSAGGGGTTSGCSGEFTTPAFQSGMNLGSCAARADVDVSAVAENVASYVGGGWVAESGTSCASPLVAALLTRLGLADKDNAYFYAHGSSFYDVTSGNNDPSGACKDIMCNAGAGWDGPTGWGSPNATALLGVLDSDAGAGGDAGAADAGPGSDAGAGTDAGKGSDAGHGADAGGDASTSHDGGSGEDASLGQDSGGTADATAPGQDGATVDGAAHDAGHANGDGGDDSPGSNGGCGCKTAGSSAPEERAAWLLVGLAGVFVGMRRRRGTR